MGAPIALLLVIGAIGAALVALGWALSQVRAIVDAVVEFVGDLPDAAKAGLGVAVAIGAALVALGVLRGRR